MREASGTWETLLPPNEEVGHFNHKKNVRWVGKLRPLGIPVVSDKVVQTTVSLILSAIFEQDFLSCSHDYRRGKGPQRAALKLIRKSKYSWVYDARHQGIL